MADNLLTHQACKNAKPRDRLYRKHDGRGLYLVIEPTGTKKAAKKGAKGGTKKGTNTTKKGTQYFVLRYKPLRPDGTRGDTYLGLGAFPETSLDDARTTASELRAVIKSGRDPRAYLKVKATQAAQRDAETFESLAKAWIERNRGDWSSHHIERNEGLLRRILYPTLGDLPIASIDRPTMLAPLLTTYEKGQKESARRARAVAAQVFQH